MHGDERDKYRRYAPHSRALGRARTDKLAPETMGRVLAKTKTKTNPPPPPGAFDPLLLGGGESRTEARRRPPRGLY